MIAFFANDSFLGSATLPKGLVLPCVHFCCPSCGDVWARIIAEPGDYHRFEDTLWCAKCARTNTQGIWDGVIDVHYFPEYLAVAPKGVLIHNFLQLYDNRVRLDAAKVPVVSSIKYQLNNDSLISRLKEHS